MTKNRITNPVELSESMRDFKYGYVDINGKKHSTVDEYYDNTYRLRSADQIQDDKIGICWDQVELERQYFELFEFDFKTYFIVYYDNPNYPTHTFLVYFLGDKVYWFENSWARYRGIHEYDDIASLICEVKKLFVTDLAKSIDEDQLCLYEYKKPSVGMNNIEFCKHCESSDPLDILWAKENTK